MRCEVVAIGTELLLGQIVDTNSSWIGEQLALAGIDSLHQTKVGDNLDRIVGTLRTAIERSDAVICCGGLGPTQDDLTRDAIAAVLGVGMVRDDEIVDRLLHMFGSRGRPMPTNNLRQADRPDGAEWIPVMPGTAAGIVCEVEGTAIYAVPGVPWEMRDMVTQFVVPDLQHRAGITAVIRSRTLRTWGQSESGLAEELAGRITALDESGDATIAFLASGIEGLKVRITAKAPTADEADAIIAAEEALVREVIEPYVFGVDDQTMESVVLDLLAERGLTLGVAESLTGGLLGSRLSAVPGASRAFRGGVIAYATDIKHGLLSVPDGPVVSVEAAAAMALGVRTVVGSDVGVAVTGVAGPDPQEGKPPGTVCMAVALSEHDVFPVEVRLPGGRAQVREFTVISVLDLLRRRLLDVPPTEPW